MDKSWRLDIVIYKFVYHHFRQLSLSPYQFVVASGFSGVSFISGQWERRLKLSLDQFSELFQVINTYFLNLFFYIYVIVVVIYWHQVLMKWIILHVFQYQFHLWLFFLSNNNYFFNCYDINLNCFVINFLADIYSYW